MTTATSKLTLNVGRLTAASDDRAATGLLLPFGEVGTTNLGKLTAKPGTIALPPDVSILPLNDGHKQTRARGRFLTAAETAEGIVASFYVGATPEGDAILAAIAEGTPPALSVELDNVTVNDAREIVAADLTGAAIVERGAYPSARLVAEDHTPTIDPATDQKDHTMSTPTPAPAPVPGAAPTPAAPSGSTFDDFLTACMAGDMSTPAIAEAKTLFAALADNKFDGSGATGTATRQPAWLGELWAPARELRRIIPLFKSAPLTQLEFTGYRWKTKPEVGAWAGNKTAIPSTGGTTEKVTGTAQRFAGGFDSAIEFTHFGQSDLIEQLVKFLIESYAIKSDAHVLEQVLAAATPLTPGEVPTDVAPALSWIIDGALALVADDIAPTFALVSPTDWRDVILSPKDHRLEFLASSFGIDSGNTAGFAIRPDKGIEPGTALVGARDAMTVLELPGAPVRVSALDIARGGVDDAVFGYVGTIVDYPAGLQLVTAETPAP